VFRAEDEQIELAQKGGDFNDSWNEPNTIASGGCDPNVFDSGSLPNKDKVDRSPRLRECARGFNQIDLPLDRNESSNMPHQYRVRGNAEPLAPPPTRSVWPEFVEVDPIPQGLATTDPARRDE
jgi:hypothetical protein